MRLSVCVHCREKHPDLFTPSPWVLGPFSFGHFLFVLRGPSLTRRWASSDENGVQDSARIPAAHHRLVIRLPTRRIPLIKTPDGISFTCLVGRLRQSFVSRSNLAGVTRLCWNFVFTVYERLFSFHLHGGFLPSYPQDEQRSAKIKINYRYFTAASRAPV